MGAIDFDFDQLFSLYSKRMNYIAYSFIKDRFLAEDIVQEAFIKAFNKLGTIEDKSKMGAWLAAITARTAMDFLRYEKRKNCVLAEPEILEQVIGFNSSGAGGMNPDEEVEIRLLKEELNVKVRELSKEAQDVLILKHQHGLKEAEIANLLHLKAATVKTRLYRARKQLKQAYAQSIGA